MGRRKVSMGLIANRRLRVATFGKRKEGLKKKAVELGVLCGVEVALVVTAAEGDAGAGAADVWESREGVLARYRALDPEVRARHAHRGYLLAELGKEEAKLARVRQGGPDGLARWDKALDGVDTTEEARRLLDAVDAAIRATDERRRALGLPVGEGEDAGAGVVLEEVAPLNFAAAAAEDDDYYLLPAPGGNGDASDHQAMWGSDGFQFQQGSSAASMQQAGYGFQQGTSSSGAGMDGYYQQMAPDMYGTSDNHSGHLADAYHQQYQPRDAGAMQHGYGFQCARAGYFGVPSGYQMQQVLGTGASQSNNLAMWSGDESRLAMVPFEYPPADAGLNYMDTPAAHGAQGSGGGSFAMGGSGTFVHSPPPLSLAMGTGGVVGGNFINAPPAAPSYTMGSSGDNFTNVTPAQPLAMTYGGDLANGGSYATQWQAAAPQPQRGGGGHQKPSIEQLHYLSDLVLGNEWEKRIGGRTQEQRGEERRRNWIGCQVFGYKVHDCSRRSSPSVILTHTRNARATGSILGRDTCYWASLYACLRRPLLLGQCDPEHPFLGRHQRW